MASAFKPYDQHRDAAHHLLRQNFRSHVDYLFALENEVKRLRSRRCPPANGSASGKALKNCFCCYDYCLGRQGWPGLVISGQSFVESGVFPR
jgi:hypothetical protein